MLHPAVKFRQNMRICVKWICKAEFPMKRLYLSRDTYWNSCVHLLPAGNPRTYHKHCSQILLFLYLHTQKHLDNNGPREYLEVIVNCALVIRDQEHSCVFREQIFVVRLDDWTAKMSIIAGIVQLISEANFAAKEEQDIFNKSAFKWDINQQ